MANRKSKYHTKTVRFGAKELTLYSLDGITWSTRKSELLAIKERHDTERQSFAQLRGAVEESTEEKATEAEGEKKPDDPDIEVVVEEDNDEKSSQRNSKKPAGKPPVQRGRRPNSSAEVPTPAVGPKGKQPLKSVLAKKRISGAPSQKNTKTRKKAA